MQFVQLIMQTVQIIDSISSGSANCYSEKSMQWFYICVELFCNSAQLN